MSNKQEQVIKWSILEYDHLKLHVAKTEKGMCYIGSPGQTYKELEAWIRRHFPKAILIEKESDLKTYLTELYEYLEGKRQVFNLPLDIKGTPFQEEVWNAIRRIPYGELYTYSDIANVIDRPKAVRAVGSAIGANPVLITVPCHRVIGKNGAITGYRGGIEMKNYLLQLERKLINDERAID